MYELQRISCWTLILQGIASWEAAPTISPTTSWPSIGNTTILSSRPLHAVASSSVFTLCANNLLAFPPNLLPHAPKAPMPKQTQGPVILPQCRSSNGLCHHKHTRKEGSGSWERGGLAQKLPKRKRPRGALFAVCCLIAGSLAAPTGGPGRRKLAREIHKTDKMAWRGGPLRLNVPAQPTVRMTALPGGL